MARNSQTESFLNNAFDWPAWCDATCSSHAAPALHSSDPKCFWIDMGLSGTIKKCKTFIPETIKKQLGIAQTCPDLQKNTTTITAPASTSGSIFFAVLLHSTYTANMTKLWVMATNNCHYTRYASFSYCLRRCFSIQ